MAKLKYSSSVVQCSVTPNTSYYKYFCAAWSICEYIHGCRVDKGRSPPLCLSSTHFVPLHLRLQGPHHPDKSQKEVHKACPGALLLLLAYYYYYYHNNKNLNYCSEPFNQRWIYHDSTFQPYHLILPWFRI